ncbi:hypothetical protein CANDROIZ_190020 [Candidatus Roizmanbacteria bacterium]|nr:hypothetical protein CANDROIZ_190020 [Candidatus Roizmanbacteria bacterium]
MTLNFISPWEPSPFRGLPSRKKLSVPLFLIFLKVKIPIF